MMRRAWIAAAAFCAALVLPALAAAQTLAYASYDGYTNVRAGPSTRYQIIAQLAPGTAVDVLGCLETRAWCQILIDDLEGWVYSRRLEFDYSGQRYLVPDYYSYFNAPFVYFNFGNYDNYDHRRRRRDNNITTECLAPDGFCPGERHRQRHDGAYEDIRPGPRDRAYEGGQVSSGGAEVVMPPDESQIRGNGGVLTECLAPDGFCR
jgi:uncharacterized protein YraI